MGQVQQLRHAVREEVVAYAGRHPSDYDAHMTAAVVTWLLAGRPGMTHDQQLAHLHQAQQTITSLATRHPLSAALAFVQEHMRQLIATVSDRTQMDQDARFLALFAGDFDQWAAELRRPDED